MEGWIKLHRKMVNWEWYQDNNVKAVFLHLLLTANHSPQRWQGIEVEAGEKVTSLEHLSQETGLSVRQIRTAIGKLEQTGEIERKATSRYTLIKLLKYSDYQDFDYNERQTKDKQSTNQRQTNDKQATTNNNDNNIKNDNNDKTNKKYGAFENVILSEEEYKELKAQGNSYLIDELSTYIASTGKQYASHYATLLGWSKKREKEKARESDKNRLSNPPSFDIKKLEYEAMFNDDYDVL